MYPLRLSHQNRVQRLQLEESCVSCLKINLAIYSAFNIVLILLSFIGMMGLLFFHGIISLVCNATLLLSLSYSVPAVSPGDPSDGVVLGKGSSRIPELNISIVCADSKIIFRRLMLRKESRGAFPFWKEKTEGIFNKAL